MAAERCNSETASSYLAMKRQCRERQASLKPTLLCGDRSIVGEHCFTFTRLKGLIDLVIRCERTPYRDI